MKLAPVIRSHWKALLLIALAAMLLVAAAGWLMLPYYLERNLLPGLARPFGIELALKARRIGPSGADFAEIKTGSAASIDSVRADYRIGYPFAVKNVTISGVRLDVSFRDGRWSIAGIPLERFQSAKPKAEAHKSRSPVPPYLKLETIELRNVTLSLDYNGKLLEVPCSVDLRIRPDVFGFNGVAKLGKSELAFDGIFETSTGTTVFNLRSPRLDTRDVEIVKLPAATVELKVGSRYANGILDADVQAAILPSIGGLQFDEPVKTDQKVRFAGGKLTAEGKTAPFSFRLPGGQTFKLEGETVNSFQYEPGAPLALSVKPPEIRSEFGAWQLKGTGLSAGLAGDRMTFGAALSARSGELEIRLPKLSGDFPLMEPAIDFGSIYLNGKEMARGSLKGKVEDSKFRFESLFAAAEFPGLELKAGGEVPLADYQRSVVSINLPPWRPQAPVEAQKLLATLPDFKLNGTLSAGLTLRFERGAPVVAGKFALSDGEVANANGDFKVSGAALNCQWIDLAALRSAPSQRLTVKRIEFGKFLLTDADVQFQTESMKDLLIESTQIKWCGGNVQTRALRLYSGQRSLRTTVYCDNINLAKALKEMGVADAEGEGVLSGQIPLRLNADGVTFEQGYLHTDPGHGGSIKIGGEGGEMISAMAQSVTEGRLFQEALKDFNYQWAKLHLSTDSENLKLQLLFDGKPAGALPFAQGADGRLTYHAEGKATFQGLQLNVNLRLPLNRLLKINQLFHNPK